MTKKARRAATGAALAAFVVGIALWAANAAYNRAGGYFERAGYIANCLTEPKAPATASDCSSMSAAPDQLADVPLNDEALALSYASSIHSTATAILTIGSIVLSLVVGTTGWIVASTRDDETPRSD